MSNYELSDAITTCEQLAAEATDPTALNEILTVLQSAKQTIEDLEYDLDTKDNEISSLEDTISNLTTEKEDLQEEVNDLEDQLRGRDEEN